MALATFMGVSEVSNSNTHTLHKARSCTWLHIRTSMLLLLLLTNRTFLQSPPKKPMKYENGCSVILDGCCTALTTTVPTCWARLCYVVRPNSATRGSAPFNLSLRRRKRGGGMRVWGVWVWGGVGASFDYLWLNVHVRSKKCILTKSRSQEICGGLWVPLWVCSAKACSSGSSASHRDIGKVNCAKEMVVFTRVLSQGSGSLHPGPYIWVDSQHRKKIMFVLEFAVAHAACC